MSWLLEKRHQINYWWILHNYRIIYEYSLQVILHTLFLYLTTAIYSAQKKYSWISTSTISWRTLEINLHYLLSTHGCCVSLLFLYHLHFFSLSKISLNILLIFRLKKFSAVCSFYWVLPGYLISGDWIKMPFFLSISCQVYAKTACAEFGGARMFKTTQNSVEDLFYHKLK